MSTMNFSSDRFHAIIDSLNDGLWVTDGNHHIVYANQGMATIAGVGIEQLLGVNVLDGFPEGVSRHFRAEYLAALEAAQPRPYECRVITPAGRDTWQRGWLTPMLDDGVFSGMMCTVQDDSERRSLDEVQAFLARTCSIPAGEPFFRALARYLADCLGLPYVCINRLDGAGLSPRTLAFWCVDHFADPADLVADGVSGIQFPQGIGRHFPDAQVCQELGLQTYLETTLWSHTGAPIGLLAVMGKEPLQNRVQAELVLKLVAGRAAAELERLDAEFALREAKERLRRSEERFRLLVDGSPVGQLLAEPESLRVVACNPAGAEMLGYAPEEMLQYRICDFDIDLDRDGIEQYRQQVVNNGQKHFETRVRRRDGAIRNLSVSLVLLHTSAGARIHTTHLDITERKQAEADQQASAQRLRQLLQDIPAVAIQSYGQDGTAHYWNAASERLYGYAAGEAIGCNMLDRMLPPERHETRNAILRLFAGGPPLPPLELSLRRKDGTPLSVLSSHALVQNPGEAPELFRFDVDLSELKRMDEALRQRAQYQRALLDNFPFMVWLKDEQSRFLAVNQAFADVFGSTSPESLIGRSDLDISPPELAAAYRADDRAVMAGGHSQQVEELITTGGDQRWFETYKSPVVVDGRMVGTVGFARDITERKSVEAALLEAKGDAERANRAKSRFLAAASHDLRQPLSALSLYVSVLQQKVGTDSRELVTNIQNCLDSLSELLAKLLDVSKLDAGVVMPKRIDFAVDDLLSTLVSVHAAEAVVKGLRLCWRNSGATAYTDQVLLRRILGNFLANAIRYTDRGGVLIACRRQGGKNWVEVWDTGIGIPEDKIDVIFEEFSQLGDDARRRGSGLGLAIVAKTARLLNLEIRVRSQPGRGSLFAIELPPGRAAMVAENVPVPGGGARSVRIGLVEDNTELRNALVCALGNAGHEVVAAGDGATLFALLGERPPGAVISDYRLAERETGFDVIQAARAQFGENLPALLITGDTDPALVRSMADRGIPVCYKPLQVSALLAFISEATERRSR
ncbi:MAG: PAS domain S-box protein [Dechloromonas sp.]|nr:PAS domain S-box protein [Dechloromonas sp.]